MVFLLVDDRLHVVLLVDDFRVLAHEVLLHEGRILHNEVGASTSAGHISVGGGLHAEDSGETLDGVACFGAVGDTGLLVCYTSVASPPDASAENNKNSWRSGRRNSIFSRASGSTKTSCRSLAPW